MTDNMPNNTPNILPTDLAAQIIAILPSDKATKFVTLWSKWSGLHLKFADSMKFSSHDDFLPRDFLAHRARIFSAMVQLLTEMPWRQSLKQLLQEHDDRFQREMHTIKSGMKRVLVNQIALNSYRSLDGKYL